MDPAVQVQDSAVSFPSMLPEATLAFLFSKKNIDRIVERSRQLNLTQSAPERTALTDLVLCSERKPAKRPPDSLEDALPSAQRTLRQFDTLLNSRLTQWESRDRSLSSRKSLVQDKTQLLYRLHCRVAESGGYFRVTGFDLWRCVEEDIGLDRDTARQMYEDFLAIMDPALHPDSDPNPKYWPLGKLKKAVVVPSLCVPDSDKALKRILPLSCCIFRGDVMPHLNTSDDLMKWARVALRLSPIREQQQTTSVTSTEIVIDNSANYGVPLMCLNCGNSVVTVRILRSEEGAEPTMQYWFTMQDPGDVLFIQGTVKLAMMCEEGSAEIVTVPGLSQDAGRLVCSLEVARAGTAKGKIALFSLVMDLLHTETPLLSAKSRFLLAEQLKEELADWDEEDVRENTETRACSQCMRLLFILGRKCDCGSVLCRSCRCTHACAVPNFVWVGTDLRDPSKTLSALDAIQQHFRFGLAVSSNRKHFVASRPEPVNGHKS